MEKVTRVETQLEQAGHTLKDGKELLDNARARLRACVEYWNNGDFREAYHEAERTLRPLRIMMRAQWQQATTGLDSPVASPYAVSFFTLPRHWAMMDEVKRSVPGSNVLADGNFEGGPGSGDSWTRQEITLDEVSLAVRTAAEHPKDGKQCLMLQITPKDTTRPAPEALERTYLGINSPAVRAQPGSLVQISGWVKIPKAITASVDGAVFYDSIGGEPLGVRLLGPTGWKKFTLYRRVPASGSVNVTVGLTGLGSVYFDDLRVEPLSPRGADVAYQPPAQPGTPPR
jgi:hypothetical protein